MAPEWSLQNTVTKVIVGLPCSARPMGAKHRVLAEGAGTPCRAIGPISNVTPIGGFAGRQRAPLLPRELSDRELALFVTVSDRREVSPGEVIFRRGELGRSMFIVESGQIRLEFGDGMPDKLIGPREFFGELTLFIGDHTRVANAVATTASVMHVIEQQAFDQLLDSEPRLLAQFMRRSFSYLVASEQQLIASLKRRNEDLMVTLDSLRQTQTQLSTAQRLVQTDELTGLCNRRGLYMFLEHSANRACGHRTRPAADRHRSLQADQRPLRPSGRRPGPARDRRGGPGARPRPATCRAGSAATSSPC